MGGRLRKCFKGVAIHYGREGGGDAKEDVVIRVWGRLRRLQSAECRIFVWWRTSKVGDVWRQLRTLAAQKRNNNER